MNQVEKRFGLLEKAEAILARRPYGKQDEAEFKSVMLLADSMADGARRERIAGIIGAEARTKSEEEVAQFRSFTRGETRTYTELNAATGNQGDYFIPQVWRAAYQSRLVSSSGILKSGATLTDGVGVQGRKFLSFYSDDSSTQAQILAEGVQLTQSNPVAAVNSPNVVKFGTSVSVSNELIQDSAFDIDAYLQGIFASRVARKFNNWATTDGTNGILAQVTVGSTSTSTAVPAMRELVAMQGQIDPGYLEADSAPCYQISPTMRVALMQVMDSNGRRQFPELLDNQLCGFPVCINVDLPTAAGSTAILFGSAKRGILVQQASPILVRSLELRAEFAEIWFGFWHRMGIKLVDSNALVALALHA